MSEPILLLASPAEIIQAILTTAEADLPPEMLALIIGLGTTYPLFAPVGSDAVLSFFTPTAPNGAFPLFVGSLPDQPDYAGCVYDTAGFTGPRLLASGQYNPWHGFQLRVRGLDYGSVFRRATNAAAALTRAHGFTVAIDGNNFMVDTVRQTSPVAAAGLDENRRSSVTFNGLLGLLPIA